MLKRDSGRPIEDDLVSGTAQQDPQLYAAVSEGKQTQLHAQGQIQVVRCCRLWHTLPSAAVLPDTAKPHLPPEALMIVVQCNETPDGQVRQQQTHTVL